MRTCGLGWRVKRESALLKQSWEEIRNHSNSKIRKKASHGLSRSAFSYSFSHLILREYALQDSTLKSIFISCCWKSGPLDTVSASESMQNDFASLPDILFATAPDKAGQFGNREDATIIIITFSAVHMPIFSVLKPQLIWDHQFPTCSGISRSISAFQHFHGMRHLPLR